MRAATNGRGYARKSETCADMLYLSLSLLSFSQSKE